MTNPATYAPPLRGRNLGEVGSASPTFPYRAGLFPGLRQPGAHTERDALPAPKGVNALNERGQYIAEGDGRESGHHFKATIRAALDALAPVIVGKVLSKHN